MKGSEEASKPFHISTGLCSTYTKGPRGFQASPSTCMKGPQVSKLEVMPDSLPCHHADSAATPGSFLAEATLRTLLAAAFALACLFSLLICRCSLPSFSFSTLVKALSWASARLVRRWVSLRLTAVCDWRAVCALRTWPGQLHGCEL